MVAAEHVGAGQNSMFLTNAIQVAKEQAIRLDQVMLIVREGNGFQVYSEDAVKDEAPVIASVHPMEDPAYPTSLIWIRRPEQVDNLLW